MGHFPWSDLISLSNRILFYQPAWQEQQQEMQGTSKNEQRVYQKGMENGECRMQNAECSWQGTSSGTWFITGLVCIKCRLSESERVRKRKRERERATVNYWVYSVPQSVKARSSKHTFDQWSMIQCEAVNCIRYFEFLFFHSHFAFTFTFALKSIVTHYS